MRIIFILILISAISCAPPTDKIIVTNELLEAYQDRAFEVGRVLEAQCLIHEDINACAAAHSGWKKGILYFQEHHK